MTVQNIEIKERSRFEMEAGYEEVTYTILVEGKEAGSVDMIYKDDLDEQYVESIVVDEEYRGQGIATFVLNKLAEKFGYIYFAPMDEYSQSLYEHIAEEYTGYEHEVDQGYGIYFIEK